MSSSVLCCISGWAFHPPLSGKLPTGKSGGEGPMLFCSSTGHGAQKADVWTQQPQPGVVGSSLVYWLSLTWNKCCSCSVLGITPSGLAQSCSGPSDLPCWRPFVQGSFSALCSFPGSSRCLGLGLCFCRTLRASWVPLCHTAVDIRPVHVLPLSSIRPYLACGNPLVLQM